MEGNPAEADKSKEAKDYAHDPSCLAIEDNDVGHVGLGAARTLRQKWFVLVCDFRARFQKALIVIEGLSSIRIATLTLTMTTLMTQTAAFSSLFNLIQATFLLL